MDDECVINEDNFWGPGYSSASSVNGHEFITLLETQTDDFGVGLQLESFIRTDNNQAFVSYLKTKKFDYSDTSSEYVHFKTRLLKLLIFRRAIGCATALLNGETGLRMVLNLNRGLLGDPLEGESGDNPTPLQLTAKMLCFGLTKLFIEHGADPGCDDIESRGFIPDLPLKLALDALCDHKIVKDFPACGESLYNLFSLFRHQELKEGLDTIKFLASRTKQVMILGVCCVEEWNLVKLAALLIVAWDKLVIDDNIYSSPIVKLIGLQHDLESDLEKKQIMRSMLQAFRLVEMSHSFLKENPTISMAEHEVIPLESANKLLTGAELVRLGARLGAELSRRNEDLLEMALAEKKISNTPGAQNLTIRADLHRWATLLRLGDKVLLETRLMKKMRSESMNTECIYFLPKSSEIDINESWTNSFDGRLFRALSLDDRDEFVKIVNGDRPFGSLDYDDNLPEIVRELMFAHDSANCAAAVLAGETNAFLTFREPTVGWSFLHNAAKFGDPKLTALFLENGFLADDRRDCDELKIKAALPLNVALESIRDEYHLKDWEDDNKSAIDLVTILCYDEFRNFLETTRLLVQKTTDVCSEFTLYFKKGKMIELCVLLMVAHKELLTSAFMDTVLLTSITQNAGGAGHMRQFSTFTGHRNPHEHNDPLERKKALLLLGIFGKIGDYLSAYIRLEHVQAHRHTHSEVTWLLDRAGISDALVSETDNTLFRMYFSDHKSVLGRENRNSSVQHCVPKLPARNTHWKQGPVSLPWTRGTSSMVFARAVPTPVPKINANFASLASAKRPVDLLRYRHPPMWCISMVAAMRSGFRRV